MTPRSSFIKFPMRKTGCNAAPGRGDGGNAAQDTPASRPRMVGRARRWARVALAGPGALAGAVFLLAGMPAYWPGGAAGIDHIVIPVILFPMLWAGLLLYACLERSLKRASAVLALTMAVNAALVFLQFSTAQAGQ